MGISDRDQWLGSVTEISDGVCDRECKWGIVMGISDGGL